MSTDLLERPTDDSIDDYPNGPGSDVPWAYNGTPLGDSELGSRDREYNAGLGSDDRPSSGSPLGRQGDSSAEDGSALQDRENGVGNTPGASTAQLPGESRLGGKAGATPGTPTPPAPPAVRAMQMVGRVTRGRGRGLAIAAAVGVFIYLGLGFVGGSLYMVHLKETAIGKSNRFARMRSTGFMRRRAQSSIFRLVRASRNAVAEKAFLERLEASLVAEGIDIAKNEKEEITKLTLRETGEVIVEVENGIPKNGLTKFSRTESGRKVIDAVENIGDGSLASEWRGISARKNFLTRLKISFKNMFSRAPPENAATPTEQIDDALAHAEETTGTSDRTNVAKDRPGTNFADPDDPDAPRDKNGKVIQEADVVDDVTASKANEIVSAADPVEAIKQADEAAKDVATDAFEKAILESGEAALGSPSLFKVLLSRAGTILASSAVNTAFATINIAAVPQSACRLKGAIAFASNLKNVLLSVELAKFATRIMVTPSEQEAGIVKALPMKLAAIEMQGATASGGMRWMAGDSTASVSSNSLSKYGMGGEPTGTLGALYNFANEFPGTSPGVCKFVHNGFVQAGAIGVGIIVAVFGGAESGFSEGNGLTATVLTIGLEVATTIASIMLVRTASKQVATAVHDHLEVGDMFAAGVGALGTSNGGAYSAMPLTAKDAVSLELEANEMAKIAMKRQSAFERYLDIHSPQSLVGKVASRMPFGAKQTTQFAVKFINDTSVAMANPATSIAKGLYSKSAYADPISSPQCTNEYYKNVDGQGNGVVTDPFCNILTAYVPNLEMQNTIDVLTRENQIDATTLKPVAGSEFDSFIKNCLSGRTNLLHKENVSKNGSDDPKDNTCVTTGAPLASDKPETFYAVRGLDKPNIWDKLTGTKKVYAQSEDEVRTPGKHERFAQMNGYLIDAENIEQEVTGEYKDPDLTETGTANTTSAPLDVNGCPTGPVNDQSQLVSITGPNGDTGLVHRCIETNVRQMFADAANAGIKLGISSGWRSPGDQKKLRQARCPGQVDSNNTCGQPPTAPWTGPRTSHHLWGTAMDLSGNNGSTICYDNTAAWCASKGDPSFLWLQQNAGRYGFTGLSSEAWHWSVGGK